MIPLGGANSACLLVQVRNLSSGIHQCESDGTLFGQDEFKFAAAAGDIAIDGIHCLGGSTHLDISLVQQLPAARQPQLDTLFAQQNGLPALDQGVVDTPVLILAAKKGCATDSGALAVNRTDLGPACFNLSLACP